MSCLCGDTECPSCGVAQGTRDEAALHASYAADERDLSDDTQARPEDVPPLSEPEHDGPLPPGCVATRIGSAVLEVMAPPEDVVHEYFPTVPELGAPCRICGRGPLTSGHRILFAPEPPRAFTDVEPVAGQVFAAPARVISDATQARPEDVACEDCDAAGLDHAAMVRTEAGDMVDTATGEVLEDAPGWDKATKRILTTEGLDWAGARLREKREALEEIRRMEANELERLNRQILALGERTEKAAAPLERDAAFLESVIRAYATDHKAEILRGRRTKSALFPSGLRVGWRKEGGEYRWRQDMTPEAAKALLLEWAKDRAGLVVEVPRPDLDAVKRHLAAADKMPRRADIGRQPHTPPPGLEWVPESEAITVKVGEEK